MLINISLLIDSIRSSSKFLHRDYLELENLQSSSKNTKIFVEKASNKVSENLQSTLGKYYKTVIFNSQELNNLNFSTNAVLVEILDGISNFERALPFFAVIVTSLTKKHNEIFANNIVINFPALGDIYYAERGKGSWFDRSSSNFAGGASRLRVSSNSKIEDSLVSCDYSELKKAQKISTNIRIFDSYAYQIALLASGKLDCVFFQNEPISTDGLELFVREAGGLSYVKNDIFVASNYQLHEKIKLLLS